MSEKIGRLKKELGLEIADAARWEEVLKDRLLKADLAGLDRDILRAVLDKIHKHSQRRQK